MEEDKNMDNFSRDLTGILLNDSPMIIIGISPGGELFFLNRKAENFFQSGAEDVKGKSIRELLNPEVSEKTEIEFLSLINSDDKLIRYALENKAGEKRIFEWTFSKVYDEQKTVRQIICLGHDISERIKFESDLERRLKFERLVTKISNRFLTIHHNRIENEIVEGMALIGNFFDTDRISVYTLSPQRTLSLAFCWAYEPEHVLEKNSGVEHLKWKNEKLLANESIVINSINELPFDAADERAYFTEKDISAFIAIPLNLGGNLFGSISATNFGRKKIWDIDDLTRLRICGELLINAINRKSIGESLNYSSELKNVITEISSRFVTIPVEEIDENIEASLRTISEFIGVDAGYVNLVSEDWSKISTTHLWFNENLLLMKELLSDLDFNKYPWWKKNLARRQILAISSLDEIPVEAEFEKEELKKDGIRSCLDIPLIFHDKVMGAVGFNSIEDKREWTEDEISLLNMAGQVFINAIVRERNEKSLKESEKRYRNLFENSAFGIYQSTLDGRFLIGNPALLKMLGYENLADLRSVDIGSKHYLIPTSRENFKQILLRDGEVDGLESEYKRNDGEIIYIREYAQLIQAGDGELIIEGAIEDITDKKIAEKEAFLAKELAEKSERLKTEFLAQMSHEIRTPVNAMLSFANLIREEIEEFISDELAESFSILKNSGNRIIRTIDLILNMSEIQTGSYELNLKTIEILSDVIEVLRVEYHGMANEKGIELFINRHTDDLSVHGDEYTIIQIFNNLIDNAVKYTDSGSISIDIRRTEQNQLSVSVTDTGIGISEEYQKTIFEPFTQEQQGYTRHYEGNGLGLALVKKYCELNNAEISVESKKGEGSKFTVIFN